MAADSFLVALPSQLDIGASGPTICPQTKVIPGWETTEAEKRLSQLRPSPSRPVSPGGVGDANRTIQARWFGETLMLGLVFERFPLLGVISCQSVGRGGFVCTKLLSSASETQLSHGPGPQQDNRSEPMSLWHSLAKGNRSDT